MSHGVKTISIGMLIILSAASVAWGQKYGGVLRSAVRGDPPSLSIHEESTNDTMFSVSAHYNNLVYYDPFKSVEGPDAVIPELAERWSWNADHTALTFFLRRGVTWHDGKPFASNDVKHTFDVVRGAARERLRLNPRKGWYANVREITTNGDHEVTFQLKRRQPALVMMLAGGYSPVYPAHVNTSELRRTAIGTGPFRLKQYDRGKKIELEKYTAYFVKGRPYMDGLNFTIIRSLASRTAALQAGQLDMAFPLDTTRPVAETLRAAVPEMRFVQKPNTSNVNILINATRPPFDNPKVRQAINLALDRDAFNRTVFGGVGVKAGVLLPPPDGHWGPTQAQLAQAPGLGDPEQGRAEARRILQSLGFSPSNPLRVKMSTRGVDTYKVPAVFVAGELKKVGIETEIEEADPAIWYNKMARRDYSFATNVTGYSVDDPDPIFDENFRCHAQRNYSDFCDPEMEKRFDAQSTETDEAKRLAMARAIDLDMQAAVVRPVLAFRTFLHAHWPYVKNYIPSQSLFNRFRFQEVWLDK
ncbi:MAG: ABC transporter substrate-binding protein [Candidatus Lambdaproteobacteria bacterium]|nr:ABC transporter substrate-binding protein [Candidatus Lambdaproteobacteria bacterium]